MLRPGHEVRGLSRVSEERNIDQDAAATSFANRWGDRMTGRCAGNSIGGGSDEAKVGEALRQRRVDRW